VSMDTIDAGGGTTGLAFSPDGQQVLTLDASCANLWSTKDGELLFKLNLFGVRDAAFLPDGKHVVATADLGNTGVYDLATGECVVEAPPGFLVTDAPAITLSPDGKRFAVSGAGQTIVWERAK